MASKKRLDYYGFKGYQVPPTPRAARSARRRSITQRKVDDNQMSAFDLLACIAGKLLVDGESSPTAKDNNIKNGDLNEDHRTMIGTSCNKKHTLFLSDLVSQPSVSINCLSDIPHSPNSTFSNVELSFSRNHIPPSGSLPSNRDDVKLGSFSRDDDENSMRWDSSLTSYNKAFRKLLACKCWELNPKSEDKEHADVGDCLKHEISLRDYPYKKRKLYTFGSVGNSSNGPSTLSESERLPFSPGDSHVKLKIKSFRVPELFIEIPESATIGSLKRTVMEAVTAILGGGLCVGVLFQGKKVRDDKKTLLQTGISHNDKLDALGFTLEPNPSPDPQLLVCPEEHSQLYYDSPKPLKSRYPPACSLAHAGVKRGPPDDIISDEEGTNLINFIEGDCDLDPSHPDDVSSNKSAAGSRILVPVSGANMESRATVPVWKPKRNKAERRRIRRPFSVAEVEALVQAVEKLGTGRWRDVKLRAFDEAKHRTYVDLKDKWKTLVHTARISPQQRRGEPVPQELLDRVLAAHAYWTQKQAKLMQIKHLPETGLLL